MAVFLKPDLTRAWASGAAPPDVTDPDSVIPGKYAAGWQAEIPPYEFFNFLQNQFSGGLAHINQNGIGVWDPVTDYQNGALVMGSNGWIYRALSDNQGVNPTTNATQSTWRVMFSERHKEVNVFAYFSNGGNQVYVPDANVTSITIELIGGGGGGGGIGPTSGGQAAIGSGGGGGAYIRSSYSRAGLWFDQIAVNFGGGTGAGGAAGPNAGANGPSVSATVGTGGLHVLGAGGGDGGLGMGGQIDLIRGGSNPGVASVSGSASTDGVFISDGTPGGPNIVASGLTVMISHSGGGPFGGAKRSVATANNGGIAGFGCGGGSVYANAGSPGSYSGADGGLAVAIITEHYV
jgi:hypothetical protein